MSLISNQVNNPFLKDDLLNQKKSYNNQKKSYNIRKCNLKNKIGLITPQLTDDFTSLHKLIETEKSTTTNTNNTNENITNNKTLKDFTTELCTKKIITDSSQVIVQCKPMMNSTASKTLMKEYSESKRYKEDIKENNEYDTDDIEEVIKYQEKHLPVPLSKKDDEKYKILKMKQMKRVSMPSNKSVRKFAEDIEPKYEKEFRIHNAFSSMKKKKPVHSTRRIYFSNFFLHKKKGESEAFMVFRDKDIGIYEYWQAHIHESHNDEDVETDDEQKKIARNFSISEVKEGLEYIKNNGNDAFVNFNRYEDFIENGEDIMDNIKDNLNIFVFNKKESKMKNRNNNINDNVNGRSN